MDRPGKIPCLWVGGSGDSATELGVGRDSHVRGSTYLTELVLVCSEKQYYGSLMSRYWHEKNTRRPFQSARSMCGAISDKSSPCRCRANANSSFGLALILAMRPSSLNPTPPQAPQPLVSWGTERASPKSGQLDPSLSPFTRYHQYQSSTTKETRPSLVRPSPITHLPLVPFRGYRTRRAAFCFFPPLKLVVPALSPGFHFSSRTQSQGNLRTTTRRNTI